MSTIVGIPTLNGSHRLRRLLASIRTHTDFARHPGLKLVVCDDGSAQDQVDGNAQAILEETVLREKVGLELIKHDARRGIARSWNDLTRSGTQNIVVLLNDDIEVVDHWLDALVYTLERNTRLGMVGLNSYVNITKQGFEELHPGKPYHIRKPRIDYREAKLLSGGGYLLSSQGCAFGFTREAFDSVEGFDERFFCFYEEVDFGIRLRMQGRPNYILSYPIIFHEGGATTSNPHNMDASHHMERSRQLFYEKWGRGLEEIRQDFMRTPPENRVFDEWNTQIHNWR